MITTTDPATGEEVTIRELANRTGLGVECLHYRYKQGDRGRYLIRPRTQGGGPGPAEARRLKEIARRHGNRIALKAFLASPAGKLTTNLLKDYGRVA